MNLNNAFDLIALVLILAAVCLVVRYIAHELRAPGGFDDIDR